MSQTENLYHTPEFKLFDELITEKYGKYLSPAPAPHAGDAPKSKKWTNKPAKRLSPRQIYTRIFRRALNNTGKRGIACEMTRDEFEQLVHRADGRCEVSGIAFDFDMPKEKGAMRPFGASLDRIDCNKPYSLTNCRLVCVIVNFALNQWGEEPFYILCKAVADKRKAAI